MRKVGPTVNSTLVDHLVRQVTGTLQNKVDSGGDRYLWAEEIRSRGQWTADCMSAQIFPCEHPENASPTGKMALSCMHAIRPQGRERYSLTDTEECEYHHINYKMQ